MKPTSPIYVAIALLLAFTPFIHAGTPKKKPTPPPNHKVIGSVSSDSITVTSLNSSATYQINKQTKCFLKGASVTPSELKPGMRVTVTPGFDGKTAAQITASDAPKAAPAASPAKK